MAAGKGAGVVAVGVVDEGRLWLRLALRMRAGMPRRGRRSGGGAAVALAAAVGSGAVEDEEGVEAEAEDGAAAGVGAVGAGVGHGRRGGRPPWTQWRPRWQGR